MKQLHVQLVILDDEDFLGHSGPDAAWNAAAIGPLHPGVLIGPNILKLRYPDLDQP